MLHQEAQLVHDNADAGAPDGVRALATVDGRQLVFRHSDIQVELMVQTCRPGPVVWGKVVRADSGLPCAGARAALLDRTDKGLSESCTDAWGEFCLAITGTLSGVLRVEFDGAAFVCWLGVGGSRSAEGASAR